jgi:hypothetical protein
MIRLSHHPANAMPGPVQKNMPLNQSTNDVELAQIGKNCRLHGNKK